MQTPETETIVLSLLQLPTQLPVDYCKYKFSGQDEQKVVLPEQVRQAGLHISHTYDLVFNTVTPAGQVETHVISY